MTHKLDSKILINNLELDTLFLDRDGVINIKLQDKYVRNYSEFTFANGALNAIRNLSNIFKRIIIVTNQQGIGKGIMSVQDLISIHESMIKEIQLSKGKIDQIYYCPHLASEFCSCRKPRNGMIKKALIDFPSIDFSKSFLVGDSDTDIELAKAMKIEPIKVDNSYTLDIWCRNFFNL
tara:strand:+ start:1630 stop:2163 length:534 start_codon:yes stop_codon:yes gene_type:complete